MLQRVTLEGFNKRTVSDNFLCCKLKTKKHLKPAVPRLATWIWLQKGLFFRLQCYNIQILRRNNKKSKNKNKKFVILCIIRGLAIFTQNLCLVRLLVALTGNHSAVALEDLVNGDSSIMTFQSCCLWYGCFKDRNQVGNRLQPSSNVQCARTAIQQQ